MNKYLRFIFDKQYRFSILTSRGIYDQVPDEKFLKKKYKLILGKELNLDCPQTFNEKLQWLKLYDRKPIYTTMVDKYEVKKYVADIIGEEYIIPTIGVWNNFDEIDFDSLPDRFVLKCTHDSGGLVICRDKSKLDMSKAKEKIERSLKHNYYWLGREWPYKDVKPRIIAEEYIGDIPTFEEKHGKIEEPCKEIFWDDLQKKHGLLDYKFMCFGGKVKMMFLDIGVIGTGQGHAEEYYRNVYDHEGNLLPVKETRENYPQPVVLPVNFYKMVEIAEILSKGIPHIRVDLYHLNSGEIKVGELTFFHGSGMSNVFIPECWDEIFGSWITLPEKTEGN